MGKLGTSSSFSTAGRSAISSAPRRMLMFGPLDAAHTISLHWDHATDTFLGWYVNLQEPMRPSAIEFDTFDQMLDIWIEPDGSWRWKDWDELIEAEQVGIFAAPRPTRSAPRGGGDRQPRPAANRLGGVAAGPELAAAGAPRWLGPRVTILSDTLGRSSRPVLEPSRRNQQMDREPMQVFRLKRLMLVGAVAASLALGAAATGGVDEVREALAFEDDIAGRGDRGAAATGLVGTWQVSGRTIRVTEATEIDQEMGSVDVGVAVEVEGEEQPGRLDRASEVEVEDPPVAAGRAPSHPSPSGQVRGIFMVGTVDKPGVGGPSLDSTGAREAFVRCRATFADVAGRGAAERSSSGGVDNVVEQYVARSVAPSRG